MKLRIIYWIPVVMFFILNMSFKLIIFILQNFGNVIVWCNKLFVKAGDWATDKAQNDNGIDNFLEQIQKQTIVAKNRKVERKNK